MWKIAEFETFLISTGLSLGLVLLVTGALGLAMFFLASFPISLETLPALWIGKVNPKTLSLRRKLGRAEIMPSALLTLCTLLPASNHLNPRGIKCRHGNKVGLSRGAVLLSAARVLCGRGLERWSWAWIRGLLISLPLQNLA